VITYAYVCHIHYTPCMPNAGWKAGHCRELSAGELAARNCY